MSTVRAEGDSLYWRGVTNVGLPTCRRYGNLITAIVSLVSVAVGSGGRREVLAQSEKSHTFNSGEDLAWVGSQEIQPDLTYIEGDLKTAALTMAEPNSLCLERQVYPTSATRSPGFLGEVDNPITVDHGD